MGNLCKFKSVRGRQAGRGTFLLMQPQKSVQTRCIPPKPLPQKLKPKHAEAPTAQRLSMYCFSRCPLCASRLWQTLQETARKVIRVLFPAQMEAEFLVLLMQKPLNAGSPSSALQPHVWFKHPNPPRLRPPPCTSHCRWFWLHHRWSFRAWHELHLLNESSLNKQKTYAVLRKWILQCFCPKELPTSASAMFNISGVWQLLW